MGEYIGYWISIEEDCGQLIDESEEGYSDLYLHLQREWWSSDGRNWERQADRYVIITSGAIDPLGVYQDLEAISDDFDRTYMEIDQEDHPINATWWAVDTGNVQRGFELEKRILARNC